MNSRPPDSQLDRFPVSRPDLYLDYLEKYGYVVISGVLNEGGSDLLNEEKNKNNDIDTARSMLWNFLEENTPWNRNDKATWVDKEDLIAGNIAMEKDIERRSIGMEEDRGGGNKKIRKNHGTLDTSPGNHEKYLNFSQTVIGQNKEKCFSRLADRASENGILHKGGVGHSDVSWFVRNKVRDSGVFQNMWGLSKGTDRLTSTCVSTKKNITPILKNNDDAGDIINSCDNSLVTSFDGICVFRPWDTMYEYPTNHNDTEIPGSKRLKCLGSNILERVSGRPLRTLTRRWFHTDQGREWKGQRVSIQGFVTLYDQIFDHNYQESTGGLVVLPGSHKSHGRLCEMPNPSKKINDAGQEVELDRFDRDIIEFTDCGNQNYLELNYETALDRCVGEWSRMDGWCNGEVKSVCHKHLEKCIEARAGDLVLWDSRTLHCNTAAGGGDKDQGETVLRRGGGVGGGVNQERAALDRDGAQEYGKEQTASKSDDKASKLDEVSSTLLRAVIYVTMVPRSFLDEETRRKRALAYERGLTSTHWPFGPVSFCTPLDTSMEDPLDLERRKVVKVQKREGDRKWKGRKGLV